MLYHISNIHNLKVLKPRISTHGQAYVYAVDNLVIGLLFGAKKDDFDFIIDVDEFDRPQIYECYKNAFMEIYKGVSCAIYEVEKLGFMQGITGWNPEYVRETEVKVLNEFIVEDLYKRLLEEEKKGNIIIHRFQDSISYKKMISNHIVDRLIRFNILDKPNLDEKIRKHYGEIISILQEALSGKYL